MRDIPEEMAARIETGAATLCQAWIMRPQGGAMSTGGPLENAPLGFTDHDRDLTLDGVVCRAGSGWAGGAVEAVAGDGVGSLTLGGALDEGLDEVGILAGGFDGAEVEAWAMDWQKPELRVRLWLARLTRIRREGEAFVAELEGPLAALDRVVGRTYGRGCDAVLGDGRCRLDPKALNGLSCDRRWATCRDVFANALNFQGFPDIPGDDFLTLYPGEVEVHDGGSRR